MMEQPLQYPPLFQRFNKRKNMWIQTWLHKGLTKNNKSLDNQRFQSLKVIVNDKIINIISMLIDQ